MVEIKPSTYVKFVSDGVCCNFNFKFNIFTKENIDVYLDDVLQRQGIEVKLEKDNKGGVVIFDIPPQSGKIITIIRNLPIKRTTDFKEGGPFRASKVNHEFDYQIACIEQLSDKLSRTIHNPLYMSEDASLELPFPAKGKSIVWNEDGTGLKNSDISLDEIQSTYVSSKELYDDIEKATEKFNKIEQFATEIDDIYKHQNKVEQDLDNKSNKNFSNTNMFDYIIDEWVSDDKYSWYRKYNSGWVEQGGFSQNGDDVIFPHPFTEGCYGANLVSVSSLSQGYVMYLQEMPTKTILKGRRYGGVNHPFSWIAWGR